MNFLHIMLFLIKKIFFKIFISKINFFYKKRPNPNFNYTYLIKKLENFLKIRLMENVEDSPEIKSKKSSDGLTLGDLLKQAMEEN